MRSRPDARETVSAGVLTIGESAPGFSWLGLQAGTLAFDPVTNLKKTSGFGLQGGRVFEGQRFGLTFEALTSHPQSDLLPGQNLAYTSFSLTHLTGIFHDPAARFWPYFGQGLGTISIPKVSTLPAELKTIKVPEVHASLGFLHRPGGGFIWGLEGRYVFAFSNPDLKESRGTVLVGYTWGGRPRATGSASTPPPDPPIAPVTSQIVRAEPVVSPLPVIASDPQALARPLKGGSRVPVSPTPPAEELRPIEPAPRPMESVSPPPVAAPEVPARPVLQPPAPSVVVPIPMVRAEAAPMVAPPVPVPAPVPLPKRSQATQEGPLGADVDRTLRLNALRQGDLATALELSRSHIQSLPADRWTIRLEVAALSSTLKNAVEAFPGGSPDLFIAPLVLSGGRTAYQLFLADYPSRVDAERAAKVVPPVFLEGGQRPQVVPVSSLLLSAPPPPASRAVSTPPPSTTRAPAVPPPAAAPSHPASTSGRRNGDPSELAQRVDALRQGDLAKAEELGRKHVEALPPGRWTIRLEVATLPSTLKTAVEAFPGKTPDLYLVPIKLRSGKPAYQVLLSDYPTREAAEHAAQSVPRIFLEGGQRPKALPISSVLLPPKSQSDARSVHAPSTSLAGPAQSQTARPAAMLASSQKEGARPRPAGTGSFLSHPALWLGGLATLALIIGFAVRRKSNHPD